MDKLENVQVAKTIFAKWINFKLKSAFQPTIDNLTSGFHSGRRFYSIINVLCDDGNDNIPENYSDEQLIEKGIEKLTRCFQIVNDTEITARQLKDSTNDSSDNIVKFSWWMIKGYFAVKQEVSIHNVVTNTLLWCQKTVGGYHGTDISNFSTAWRDGCALLALIHAQKPNLFDYETRLSKTSGQNVTLALHLISQEFNCPRLLEIDNLTSSHVLDWRAICLYAMQFYATCMQQVPQSLGFTAEDLDNSTKEVKTEQLDLYPTQNSQASHRFNMNLEQFKNNYYTVTDKLERVLRNINVARVRVANLEDLNSPEAVLETFETNEDVINQFITVKDSVVEHESLMEQLTNNQNIVQTILMEGNSILEAPSVHNTNEVKAFIKEKLEATTAKWDTVCKNSTEFRKNLQKLLSNIQLALLVKIEDCIEDLDEIQSNNLNFGSTINELKEQLKVNREMEMKIEAYEKAIMMLQNFLVVSEDSEGEDQDQDQEQQQQQKYSTEQVKRMSKVMNDSTFESHIQNVGLRWNELVTWVSSRYHSLQKTLLAWRHFEEEVQSTFEWLEERICSADQLTRKSSRNQFGDFISTSESKWARVISNLDKWAQKVKNNCDNQIEVSHALDAKIDHIVQEWNDASDKWRDLLDHWTGPDSKRKSNRAASFSDMSSDDCVTRRKLIDYSAKPSKGATSRSDIDISIVDTSDSTSNPAVYSSYKHKFESDVEKLITWLENSAEKLELITLESLALDLRPNLSQQKEIIISVRREMDDITTKNTMNTIKKMGKMYQSDLEKIGENTEEIEQLFEELDERWSHLEKELLKSREKVYTLDLSTKLEGLNVKVQPLLMHHQQFIDYNRNIQNLEILDKQLQESDKLREDFSQLRVELKPIVQQHNILSEKINLSPVNTEIFNSRIQELTNQINEKSQQIEEEQDKIRERRTLMEMNLLETNQWLDRSLGQSSERFSINQISDIELELNKLTALSNKLQQYQSQVLSISPSDDSRREKVHSSLKQKCQMLSQKINKRQTFIKDLSINTTKLQTQSDELQNWLNDVKEYVKDLENQDLSNDDIKQETLNEIEAGLQDLDEMYPTIDSINSIYHDVEIYFSKELQQYFVELNQQLEYELNQLTETYKHLREKITGISAVKTNVNNNGRQFKIVAETNEMLESEEFGLIDLAVEHSSDIVEDEDEAQVEEERNRKLLQKQQQEEQEQQKLEEQQDKQINLEILNWIDNNRLNLTKYSSINSTKELQEFGTVIQKIRKEKKSIYDKFQKISNANMKSQVEYLLNQFYEHAETEYNRYEQSSYHLQNFQEMISDEDKWMGRVNKAMQQSYSCNQLDVEELSENIDEIERAVCDRSEEELNRLESIKSSLLSARVLERSVSMEFDQIKGKSLETKTKAEDRLSSLQQLLNHIQSVEKRISQMNSWIVDTTKLLKSRIAAEMLGADNPAEFEVLKQDFAEWDKFLVELEELESDKSCKGRKETSERLKVHRFKLMKSFTPLKELFGRYSRPGDFDPKLDNLKRETSRISEHIYLLDIISLNLDDVENCKKHSKQFKDSLLTLEKDLNYVYNLGKTIVEKKQVDFCERFSQKLDGLKNKYHDLLKQIQDADHKLDTAQPLIEKLTKCREKINKLLEQNTSNELSIDERQLPQIITDLSVQLKPLTGYDCSDFVKELFQEVDEEVKVFSDKFHLKTPVESVDENNDQSSIYDSNEQTLSDSMSFDELTSSYCTTPIGNDDDNTNQSVRATPIPLNTTTPTPDLSEEAARTEKQILQQLSGEMRDHIHAFILFCQQNLSPGKATAISIESSSTKPDSEATVKHPGHHHHAPITTLADLKAKLQSIKEIVMEMFKEQRIYLDQRLRELSAYAETAEQMENLDKIQKYWKDSINKLIKRIDRMEDLNKRLDSVEDAIKEHERDPSEKQRNKVLRIIAQLEEEMDVNLPRDRLRVITSLGGGTSRSDGSKDELSEDGTSVSMSVGGGGKDGLKLLRDQLKQISRMLNGVRMSIDDSKRGCISKLSNRLHEIDDDLTGCAHMLSDVQYSIANLINNPNSPHYYDSNNPSSNNNNSSGSSHSNDVINLSFLVEAQRKRMTKYNQEFQSYMSKWMENASKWQAFIERLEGLQQNLSTIEQEMASIINGLEYSDQEYIDLKKQLNSFEKKLIQLEQDGEKLSLCCNDVDADFLRNCLSELRSRITTCCQNSKLRSIRAIKTNQSHNNNNNNNNNFQEYEEREEEDEDEEVQYMINYNNNTELSSNYEQLSNNSSPTQSQNNIDPIYSTKTNNAKAITISNDLNANEIANEDRVTISRVDKLLHSNSVTKHYEPYESSSDEESDAEEGLDETAEEFNQDNDIEGNAQQQGKYYGGGSGHYRNNQQQEEVEEEEAGADEVVSATTQSISDDTTGMLATVVDNWLQLANQQLTETNQIDRCNSINQLETIINEITSLKKEALQKIAQISLTKDQQQSTSSASNASTASYSLTDNQHLYHAYQDLLKHIDIQLNQLTEIKVHYYLIDEQIKKIESTLILNNNKQNSRNWDNKSDNGEFNLVTIRAMIDKMPRGLRERLDDNFQQIESELREIEASAVGESETSDTNLSRDEKYLRQQEDINHLALLLKSINSFLVNANGQAINICEKVQFEEYINEVEMYKNQMKDFRKLLDHVNDASNNSSVITSGNQMDNSGYFITIEKVNQLWHTTEDKLTDHHHQLQKMREMQSKLHQLDQSLKTWIGETNFKLDRYLKENDDYRKRNLQIIEDVKQVTSHWQLKLNEYQSLSCELSNISKGLQTSSQSASASQDKASQSQQRSSSSSHELLSIQLEEMNRQWAAIMNKIAQCTKTAKQHHHNQQQQVQPPHHVNNKRHEDNQIIPQVKVQTATAVRSDVPTPIASDKDKQLTNNTSGINIEKLSGWLTSLDGQLESIQMSITRMKSGSNTNSSNSDKLKLKVLQQLNEMKNGMNLYEHHFEKYSTVDELSNNAEFKVYNRWKLLKDKYKEIRQNVETPNLESGQSLLTKLRHLNDWLAHKEAQLLELRSDCSSVQSGSMACCTESLGKFDRLQQEVDSYRNQIEENLELAQLKIGETLDPTKLLPDGTLNNLESEGESDNSDTGSSGNINDDKNKKINRRIRRHSHHLKRKWVELGLRLRDFHDELKHRSKIFKIIDTTIKECHQMLSEIEFYIDNWSKVSNIRQEAISHEINMTKNLLLQSKQPLIDKLTVIESQKKQLAKFKVVANHDIIDEINSINNRITSIKSSCDSRIKQLLQLETQLTKPLQHQQSTSSASYKEQEISPDNNVLTLNKKLTFPVLLSENQNFIELKNESVSYPWERCLHPSGSQVPYYKNHSTQDTQWDHPVMSEMIKSFDELNSIKFSAYRTAMKLRILQKTLCFDLVDLTSVLDTFRVCGINSSSVNERLLDVNQIIVFLGSLYKSVNNAVGARRSGNEDDDYRGNAEGQIDGIVGHSILGCGSTRGSSMRRSSRDRHTTKHTRSSSFGGEDKPETHPGDVTCLSSKPNVDQVSAGKGLIHTTGGGACSQAAIMKCSALANIPNTRHPEITSQANIPLCTDISLNWLLNVFDAPRNGKIRVLSLKVAMVILSNSFLDEKYKHLFSLVCNSQGQIDSSRLSSLLTDCVLIPKNLNEALNFVDNVDKSVANCFKNNSDSCNRVIRLANFISWLRLEPQILVWLPVLHRLISAEVSIHQAKCGVCKLQPIVGLRYRCLRCFNFDLCQACFFYSKTAKSHKVSHPMQEYCNVTSSKENIRDYSRIFRNRFRSKNSLKGQHQARLGQQTSNENKSHTLDSSEDQIKQKSTSLQISHPTPNETFAGGLSSNQTMQMNTVGETNRQIHSKVEQYATRLAEVEKINKKQQQQQQQQQQYPNNANSMPRNNNNYTTTGYSNTLAGPIIDSGPLLNSSRQLEKSDEEHRLIAEYTNTLRSQARNESILPTSSLAASTLQQTPNYTDIYQSSNVQRQHSSLQPTPVPNKRSLDYNYTTLQLQQQQIQQQLQQHQQQQLQQQQTMRSSDSSLNRVIQGLEMQKIQLLAEYDRLQATATPNYMPSGRQTAFELSSANRYGSLGPRSRIQGFDDDLATEARLLRQHKGRLEARMGVLEQHNRQLESQLIRLRQMVIGPEPQINYNAPEFSQELEWTSAQFSAAKNSMDIPNAAGGSSGINDYCYSGPASVPYKKDGYNLLGSSYHHLITPSHRMGQYTMNANPSLTSQPSMLYGSLERGSNLYRNNSHMSSGLYEPASVLSSQPMYDSNSQLMHLSNQPQQQHHHQHFQHTSSSTNQLYGIQSTNPSSGGGAQINLPVNQSITSTANQMKAASETGGSLTECEFNNIGHQSVGVNLSLTESCPSVTPNQYQQFPMHLQYPQSTAAGNANANSIGSLFHMAGQVGKAVGQLVDVMNEDTPRETPPVTAQAATSTAPISSSTSTTGHVNQSQILLSASSVSNASSLNPLQNEDLILPSSYSINPNPTTTSHSQMTTSSSNVPRYN